MNEFYLKSVEMKHLESKVELINLNIVTYKTVLIDLGKYQSATILIDLKFLRFQSFCKARLQMWHSLNHFSSKRFPIILKNLHQFII